MIITAIISTLLRVFGPDVDAANAAAAAELELFAECEVPLWEQPYDCPERVRWALVAISDRESPGNYSARFHWVGRHRRDSGHEERLWTRGLERGAKGYRRGGLHWWCPAHWGAEGMSTVGPHGLIYAFNVHRMGVAGNCVPWWVFATPSESARVARHRYLKLCGDNRKGWCPTPEAAERSRTRRCRRRELPRAECLEATASPPTYDGTFQRFRVQQWQVAPQPKEHQHG